MGKGDKRTKRGKIILGSHGNSRPKKVVAAAPKAKETTEAKPAVETPAEA